MAGKKVLFLFIFLNFFFVLFISPLFFLDLIPILANVLQYVDKSLPLHDINLMVE